MRNTSNTANRELKAVVREFAKWRRKKRYPRESIPDNLWKKAVSLYRKSPSSDIAQTLRINHGELKKRASLPACKSRVRSHKTPPSDCQTLVPVEASAFPVTETLPACIIRIQNSKGAMEICLNYGHDVDLAKFVHNFTEVER